MKYVIKNCDNYTEFDKDWTCRSTIQNRKGCFCCQDCTDCVMKRIVELCKNKDYFVKRFPNAQFSSAVQNSELAFDILQLLDIQEVK